MTRNAANEAQLGNSVENASSVHVLGIKNWDTSSSSQAFGFQCQCSDGSLYSESLKICYSAFLGGFIRLCTLKTARVIWEHKHIILYASEIMKVKFSRVSLCNTCYILKGIMEDSYLLTQAHPSELGGDGSFLAGKDWNWLYLQVSLIL